MAKSKKKVFQVEVEEIRRFMIEVKAKDFEDAEDKARKKFFTKKQDPYMVDMEIWNVEEPVDDF